MCKNYIHILVLSDFSQLITQIIINCFILHNYIVTLKQPFAHLDFIFIWHFSFLTKEISYDEIVYNTYEDTYNIEGRK